MSRQSIILIIGVIVALLAGMFMLAYLKKVELDRQIAEDDVSVVEEETFTISRVDAKHFYTEPQGVHTLAGEVTLPSACHLLDTNAVILDDRTRAVVSFDVINNVDEEASADDQCPETPTVQRFKVGFEAPKDITIEATFNGAPIELNLIPAGEGETPADFELYIKG